MLLKFYCFDSVETLFSSVIILEVYSAHEIMRNIDILVKV